MASESVRRAPILTAAVPVGELLNSANFVLTVTPYQRDYQWSRRHISKLLGDIGSLAASDSRVFHLLGNVVLVQNGRDVTAEEKLTAANWFKVSNSYNHWGCDIVDGHQRCATIVILYAAIHSHLYKSAAAEADPVRSELTKLARGIEEALLTKDGRHECMLSGKYADKFRSMFNFTEAGRLQRGVANGHQRAAR